MSHLKNLRQHVEHLSPDYWTIENQNENFVCAKINQNMVALNKLRHVSDRIKLVKYEDFVGQSENTMEDLYKFLGLSYLLPFAKHAVKNHIQAEPQETKWDKVLEGENIPKIISRHSVIIFLLFMKNETKYFLKKPEVFLL